jgi:hypothetical protein
MDLLSVCEEVYPRLAAALNNFDSMHQANENLVNTRGYLQSVFESLPNE